MAASKKKTKDPAQEETVSVPFENEPSTLDELTHLELRMMHDEAARAILFAKNIQWRTVGASLLVFGAAIAIAILTPADRAFASLLAVLTIVLACGAIFVLLMYQFWQFNEITRIRKIERHFSTLYRKICVTKSRKEGNAHRYTLLVFMVTTVILGAMVSNMAIKLAQ